MPEAKQQPGKKRVPKRALSGVTGRPPGRPGAGDLADGEAREVLIQAAARRFAAQGSDGTRLREIVDDAGMTPAMVAYYFNDKSGLLEAVVREALATLRTVIDESVQAYEPGTFLEGLIRRYLAALASAPWIPQLLIREVISRESPLRAIFVEEFASTAVAVVPERMLEEINQGQLRDDLDPRYLILSLVGMCLFPFIAHPVLGPLLNFDLDESFGHSYGAHVVELFARGARGVS
jgi:AcrR family transcriptional regulator